jgi:hypothetical protein
VEYKKCFDTVDALYKHEDNAYVLSTRVKSKGKNGPVPVAGPAATSICVDPYIKSKELM